MKKFFYGTFQPYLENELTRILCQQKDIWASTYLIVYTKHMKQHLLQKILKNHLYFNLHIYTFSEFATKICQEILQPHHFSISSILAKYILLHISQNTIQENNYLGKAKSMKGFANTLSNFIQELQINDISVDEFQEFSQQTQKCLHQELSWIYQKYYSFKQNKRLLDEQDFIQYASILVKKQERHQTATLILYGFPELTPIEKKFLQNYPSDNIFLFIPYYYNPIYSIVSPLIYWLQSQQFQEERNYSTPQDRTVELQFTLENLFQPPKQEPPMTLSSIQTFTTTNKQQEIEEITKHIITLQKQNIDLSDITVIEENLEKYHLHWRDIFQKAQLPFYTPILYLNTTPEAELFLTILQLSRTKTPWKLIKTILQSEALKKKSAEPDYDVTDWDYLATYYQWNKKSTISELLDSLSMIQTQLLEQKNVQQTEEEENRQHPWQQKNYAKYWYNTLQILQQTLQYFQYQQKIWENAKNYYEFLQHIITTYNTICLFSAFKEKVIQAIQELYIYDTCITEKNWDILYQLTQELLNQPIENENISQNAIFLTDMQHNIGQNKSYIFFTGMSENQFPNTKSFSLLLAKEDRQNLKNFTQSKGKFPIETPEIREKKQKLLFHLTLANGQKEISLWHSLLDIETNKEQLPSVYYLNVLETLYGKPISLANYPKIQSPSSHQKEYALTLLEYDLRLAETIDISNIIQSTYPIAQISQQNQEIQQQNKITEFDGYIQIQNYPQKLLQIENQNWACTQIAKYFSCPYRFYNQYILDIQSLPPQSNKYKIPRYKYRQLFLSQLREQDSDHILEKDYYPELIREIAEERIQELQKKLQPSENIHMISPFPYNIKFHTIQIEGKLDAIYTTNVQCNGNQYYFVSNSTEKKTTPPKEIKKYNYAKDERLQAQVEYQVLKQNFTLDNIQLTYHSIPDNNQMKQNSLTILPNYSQSQLEILLQALHYGLQNGIFIQHPDHQCITCPYNDICGNNKDLQFQRKKNDTKLEFLKKLNLI
ncbi:MAG TPA: PD-(D/E)XK nuclease family protein [Planctomycetota bacterium]|nr:PD-(D/E)XK nuclease family protein [Planctomycetota bacterium]